MIKEICYDWYGYNQQLFSAINFVTHKYHLIEFLHMLSQPFFIGTFAIYYAITCILSYMYLRNTPRHDRSKLFHDIYKKLLFAGCSYALFGFVYAGLKFGINLPRPYCSLTNAQFFTILDFSSERCLSSFPSAHTGMAVLVTYLVWPYVNNIIHYALLALICCIALARISVAMHYPADTIYGMMIALMVIHTTKTILHNKYVNMITRWFEIKIFSCLF